MIKDLQMRSSWIRVGPKSKNNCVYKRHTEDIGHREEAAEDGGRDWGYEVQTKMSATPRSYERGMDRILPQTGNQS